MTIDSLPTKHYIDGQWMTSRGEAVISTNPIDNSILWQGHAGAADTIDAAFAAASQALALWASLEMTERAHYLEKFTIIVESQRNTLAELIALETGKPLWEAYTEVNSVIGKTALSIRACEERTIAKKNTTADADQWLRFKPHGVVLVLGAFNFPAHLSNGHIIPALLAGNTILYKPSELTPAVAAFIMQCWQQSGVPKGVINCIHGDGKTGQQLLNLDLQGVFFTGSYATGLRIHQAFSNRPNVILALEMGGNNPLIIDTVDNQDAAIYQTILSTLITTGQRCTCARRVFIDASEKGSQLLHALIQAVKKIKIGSFQETPEPFMGPVISKQQAEKHLAAQDALMALGGNPLLKMSLLKENSALLSPGIIDMTSVANVPDEEIFAPFIQIYRYQDFEEALMLANQTRYGLAAGLLSNNTKRYRHFFDSIKAGLINWNRPTTGASGALPFGGIGLSGNHRPSAYFAADYCAYPVASLEQPQLTMPDTLLPGLG